MELLLSRPEFQKNLTQKEIDSLPTIAAQKQREKYSYPSYQFPQYNFLYTDSYCRPPYPVVFYRQNGGKNTEYLYWDFKVVEKQDAAMRSGFKPYKIDHPINQYLVKNRQKKLLTRIHLRKVDPNTRFDNCQIPQP